MSLRNFKSVHKIQDVMMIYFTQVGSSPWGDQISVTIPVADAQRLLEKLQATLHPNGAGK
jgi:hypothetical protein